MKTAILKFFQSVKENGKGTAINALIAISAVAFVAVVSSILTNTDSEWFLNLTKPTENLPEVVFPIVWSVIYAVFAIILFLLLQYGRADRETILLFAANGILQILWSFAFFILNGKLISLIIIVLTAVAAMLLSFKLLSVGKTYFYVSLIYPIWIFIAAFVNNAVWVLN